MENVSGTSANPEITINEDFGRLLWAELFAANRLTTSGLNLYLAGGQFPVNGVMTTIADLGPIALTASSTNYVGLAQDGSVVNTVTTANPAHAPLFTVVTGTATITSIVDTRNASHLAKHAHGIATQALTTANVTLTQAQALCDTLVVTGALTAARNLVVPVIRRRWAVRHTGTGFGVQIIGATGTGITIAVGKTAIVECNGTDVVRITADV